MSHEHTGRKSRKVNRLEALAFEVAILAPLKLSSYGGRALIPQSVITDIRAELTRRGIDWLASAKAHRTDETKTLTEIGIT